MDSSLIPYEISEIPKNNSDRKTFFSIWHVIISSNVKTKDLETAYDISQDLKQSFIHTFRDKSQEVFDVKRPGDQFDSHTVEKIKLRYAPEIGEDPKGGRVHLHALVEVEHHTILQVNRKKANELIRESLRENPWIVNPWVDIKWVPASYKNMEHYLGKNPLTRQADFESAFLFRQKKWGDKSQNG